MDPLGDARHEMVARQIQARGLGEPRLLQALERVPRHLFVPEEYRFAAYDDSPLPIGFDQTISQPYMVALMTAVLGLCGDERILEVGTGSGYQAAVLACLAGEVHTVELIPALAQKAELLLRELEFTNIHVHCADGSLGWPERAPYDCVVVTAAAPTVPPPLVEQLRCGGRLVLPVEQSHDHQLLKVVVRHEGRTVEKVISNVCFVPLRGAYGRKHRAQV